MTEHGGRAGGGAKLTAFGRDLVRQYRQMETDTHAALSTHLAALDAAMQRRLSGAESAALRPNSAGASGRACRFCLLA